MRHLITPDAVFSFVADGIAVGGLRSYGESLTRFGLLINVAKEFADEKGARVYDFKGIPLLSFKLDDTNDEREHAQQASEVLRAVDALRDAHTKGKMVLVTCHMGWNRSALVVAEYLVQRGAPPGKVVETIQTRRAKSLQNGTFVAWLKRKR